MDEAPWAAREWALLERLRTKRFQGLPHGLAAAEVWERQAKERQALRKIVESLGCLLVQVVLGPERDWPRQSAVPGFQALCALEGHSAATAAVDRQVREVTALRQKAAQVFAVTAWQEQRSYG